MNTPNKITLVRICLIPFIVFFYLANFIPWGQFIAGTIFVVACFTDFFDGYLARKNNQVTTLGKFLDTIADKILIMTALLLIIATPIANVNGVAQGIIRPEWFGIVCAILILMREFAVSALRQVAASKGVVLAAEKSGKVKAVFQFITLALYFFYAFFVVEFYNGELAVHKTANSVMAIILLVLLAITTILTISSGIGYLYKNKQAFVDPRKVEEKSNENMVLFVETAQEEKKEDNNVETENVETIKSTPKRPSQSKTTTKKKPAKKKSYPTAVKPKIDLANREFQSDNNGREYDALIPQALDMFWEKGWASTTMLQKHLGVGYPRASKIIDQMEELGYISSNQGAKTRTVLISKEEFEKNGKLFK